MKTIIALIFAIMLICQMGTAAKEDVDSELQKTAEGGLLNIIQKIKEDSDLSIILGKAKVGGTTLTKEVNMPAAKGWIRRWKVERGVEYVPNPNVNAGAAYQPVFSNADSVIFEIFIAGAMATFSSRERRPLNYQRNRSWFWDTILGQKITIKSIKRRCNKLSKMRFWGLKNCYIIEFHLFFNC